MERSEIISLLRESLEAFDVYKVVLFGSYAKGTNTFDSDIDVLVVTKDASFPGTFSEKMAIKLPIAHALASLRKKADLDLLVYTMPMYEKFKEMDSLLKKEIEKDGTVIYEADN